MLLISPCALMLADSYSAIDDLSGAGLLWASRRVYSDATLIARVPTHTVHRAPAHRSCGGGWSETQDSRTLQWQWGIPLPNLVSVSTRAN